MEAINAFGQFTDPTDDTKALYTDRRSSDDPTSFVPKHRKSNFTGNVRIEAILEFDQGEKDSIVAAVESKMNCKIKKDIIPNSFEITREYGFENSDLKRTRSLWGVHLRAKVKGARKETPHYTSDSEIWKTFVSETSKLIPQCVYFPTFLFVQPARVDLNPSGDEEAVNRQYREIIENVAQSLPTPLDVKKHIVERMVSKETIGEKLSNYFGIAPDKKEQVDAVMSELSAHLSQTVFDSWSKIFGGNFRGREIVLGLSVENPGPAPRVYIQFFLKDGTSIYEISERSLGFRWFFSFLLFTLYRVSAKKERSILFLLDEPASNLHSRAQIQLIESLPKIATGSNQIIYSTHSHYMINPDWLDQAFIVSNSSVDYDDVNEPNAGIRNRPTEIQIERYRNFVGKYPDRVTYFQPVLDKLDVIPSRIDINRPSVVVEGKGDYLILEYGRRVMLEISDSFSIIPTRGATGMDEIIGLLRGWAIPFVICLDADKEGKSAAKKYRESWGSNKENVLTLSDITSELDGKAIEGFLENLDLKLIRDHFNLTRSPTKSQIRLFFSEKLARKQGVTMSDAYLKRVTAFQEKISKALGMGKDKITPSSPDA